ncbi:hypothetical protein [Anaeromyxobacter oryzisoli]|jgi:hypothetical protein|uniref:hypothetical protein n=1 Tax=Anaeromyxobacter oryzisoli TaxID=2925408 RepID=UPI001F564278|nr:hypothetical protein [Anaeromyxobacter sp. SG63]
MPALHRPIVRILASVFLLAVGGTACHRTGDGPRELLDRYFSTAVRQDYVSTWACYDENYRSKVSRDEYVRHRREASRLLSWKTSALEQHGDTARAEVELVFAPSPRLGRSEPVTRKVVEELVREREGWRVKVW